MKWLMDWLSDEVKAAGMIIIGVLMLFFVFGFGELVSGQFKKEKEPNEPPS